MRVVKIYLPVNKPKIVRYTRVSLISWGYCIIVFNLNKKITYICIN